jgi:hypothetical protein
MKFSDVRAPLERHPLPHWLLRQWCLKARRCERKGLEEQRCGFRYEFSSHSFQISGSQIVICLLADI